MSPEDIDKLTIGEVRAIATQAGEALEKFRAVQMALGVPVAAVAPVAPPTPAPADENAHLSPAQRAFLNDPARLAERQQLLDQNRNNPDNFPEDIAQAMRDPQ